MITFFILLILILQFDFCASFSFSVALEKYSLEIKDQVLLKGGSFGPKKVRFDIMLHDDECICPICWPNFPPLKEGMPLKSILKVGDKRIFGVCSTITLKPTWTFVEGVDGLNGGISDSICSTDSLSSTSSSGSSGYSDNPSIFVTEEQRPPEEVDLLTMEEEDLISFTYSKDGSSFKTVLFTSACYSILTDYHTIKNGKTIKFQIPKEKQCCCYVS